MSSVNCLDRHKKKDRKQARKLARVNHTNMALFANLNVSEFANSLLRYSVTSNCIAITFCQRNGYSCKPYTEIPGQHNQLAGIGVISSIIRKMVQSGDLFLHSVGEE